VSSNGLVELSEQLPELADSAKPLRRDHTESLPESVTNSMENGRFGCSSMKRTDANRRGSKKRIWHPTETQIKVSKEELKKRELPADEKEKQLQEVQGCAVFDSLMKTELRLLATSLDCIFIPHFGNRSYYLVAPLAQGRKPIPRF
jgi:hypothetical protein